ncbi:hypothetical protein FHS31_000848 [Sphingomonas vulcanisoli]|uniref:DUF4397 domain-containing protein n=1 Tax=Sphingomonas vulcanisoli TaxID=1658060 RepID=A0ABX0TNZ7_9SPHN|nr:hypothetical protein [Sphingomonas vulcanisoli]NIJ07252.1 hypothetical protein [Sphingomonas vulcanisoli]
MRKHILALFALLGLIGQPVAAETYVNGTLVYVSPSNPTYLSGLSYRQPGAITTFTGTTNVVYYTPLVIYSTVTINALTVSVATGAAGNARIGLYSNDPTQNGPLTKLGEVTTPVDTTNAATLTGTMPAITLAPGLYWTAVLFNATPTMTSLAASDAEQLVQSFIGTNSVSTLFAGSAQATGWTQPQTYASGLPATASSISRRFNHSALVVFTVQ